MNAVQQTTVDFPTQTTHTATSTFASPRYVRLVRPALRNDEAAARTRETVRVRSVWELIHAAGPLTLRDIAGGLDVPAQQVAATVESMAKRRLLKLDEWDRYRVGCLQAA